MSKQATIKELQQLLADTYGLYLKTHNYHWHIKGPNFSELHALLEEQYESLADKVDEIAERIVMLGGQAPATFKSLGALTNIADGDPSLTWQNMLSDLASDQGKLLDSLKSVAAVASNEDDEVSGNLATDSMSHYEKQRWFLENHLA